MVDFNRINEIEEQMRGMSDRELLEAIFIKVSAPAANKPAPAPAPASHSRPAPAPDGGLVFPPYGRSKGQPVRGASLGDLDYYANGCRRTLDDPNKARWHEKERALLAAIEAEIVRQRGGQSSPHDAPPPDFGTGDDPDGIPF